MIKLIVNADDFGYSKGINYGIIEAHRNGIVNSTTMMMNMPGVSHAVDLAKENPNLKVGIHLVLTCGRPLLTDVPTLVDQNGFFKKNRDILESNISLEELEREWTAQVEKFLESGLTLTHIDSHHHVHTVPKFLPIVQKLSKKYNLSVRRVSDHAIEGVPPFSDVFLHEFYGEGATYDYFEKIVTQVQDGQTVEVMCHPGYLDHEVLNNSSYAKDRVTEVEILTSISLPNQFVLA
ncbi:chitin disaccharide deacetylase [Gottfriedia solisilvae]|uniref:Carbohydrate deacetylase n=1 Tax=Gottfriedia solisilvae TaxID=1516104 RepID=A0A8J3AP37_9BACI|nr:chitin disaccharide deacetylase [Gottfriedia solisilvae]GGI17335.1 carbohydrate deacetylase [Gottfriedia solisilvae]